MNQANPKTLYFNFFITTPPILARLGFWTLLELIGIINSLSNYETLSKTPSRCFKV